MHSTVMHVLYTHTHWLVTNTLHSYQCIVCTATNLITTDQLYSYHIHTPLLPAVQEMLSTTHLLAWQTEQVLTALGSGEHHTLSVDVLLLTGATGDCSRVVDFVGHHSYSHTMNISFSPTCKISRPVLSNIELYASKFIVQT